MRGNKPQTSHASPRYDERMSTSPQSTPPPYVAPEEQPTRPDVKKPWYTKWWAIAIGAVLVLGVIFAFIDGEEKEAVEAEPAPQSEIIEETSEEEIVETPQSLPEAPDQVGQLLSVAQANLELDGYEVESISDSGKGIWDKGNWEVIEQKQNGNKVLLTVKSTTTTATTSEDDEDAPAAPATPTESTEKTNSQGLTGTTALSACANLWETALKNEYPASKIKIHSVLGVLAQRLDDDDSWFIKIEGKIDKNLINVECSVYGSEDYPEVVPLAVY